MTETRRPVPRLVGQAVRKPKRSREGEVDVLLQGIVEAVSFGPGFP